MHNRAANTYRRVDLDSAPKTTILERLFDRFSSDLAGARGAIVARDIKGKAAAIDHALRIVAELEAALDHASAPELCANLVALYDYVTTCLIEANMHLDAGPLDHAARIMAELAGAFREAHGR